MFDVAVVGSHVNGMYMYCERLPQAGETVLGRDFNPQVQGDGGKGSNQAVCCARLGARTLFLGKVGSDVEGEICATRLTSLAINCDYLYRSHTEKTGISIALIDGNGDSLIAVDPGANNFISDAEITRAKNKLAQARVLLTQFELPAKTVHSACSLGRELGLLTILNPAPVPDDADLALTEGLVSVITPNRLEANLLLGSPPRSDVAPEDLCAGLVRKYKIPNVIVTLGEHGAMASCADVYHKIPAISVEQKNSVGAGDGFNAALAVALSHDVEWYSALVFATCVAGFAIANENPPWSSYPELSQLRQFIQQREPGKLEFIDLVSNRLSI